ncbi:phosphoglycerate mutase family protein, partial [Patescibacteria group bacterium]|nr:phosphoglycerate mutase family protein [Patescibacteria group bacterium]
MVTAYVLRHGKAEHNLGSHSRQTFAGDSVDNHLAPEGIAAARKLADRIKKMGGCDLVISSGLNRSKETAAILASALSVPTRHIADLQEINVGRFGGHTEAEARRLFPAAAQVFYLGDIPRWSFPGGEDYLSVKKRVESVEKQLLALGEVYPSLVV